MKFSFSSRIKIICYVRDVSTHSKHFFFFCFAQRFMPLLMLWNKSINIGWKIKQLNVNRVVWDDLSRGWIRRSLRIRWNIYFDTKFLSNRVFYDKHQPTCTVVVPSCISPQITVPQRFSIFFVANNFHGCWFPSVGCRFFSHYMLSRNITICGEWNSHKLTWVTLYSTLYIRLGNINGGTVAVKRFIAEKENILKSRVNVFSTSFSFFSLCTIT